MADMADRLAIATVASNDVAFHVPARKPLHDVMRCVAGGFRLADAGRQHAAQDDLGDLGTVHARVWRAQVGSVPLYLLDTDVEENAPQDRHITDRLYGGDTVYRLKQELVLGGRHSGRLGLLPGRPLGPASGSRCADRCRPR